MFEKTNKEKELEIDSKLLNCKKSNYRIKNANPNGCIVAINNQHPMIIYFFQKY